MNEYVDDLTKIYRKTRTMHEINSTYNNTAVLQRVQGR